MSVELWWVVKIASATYIAWRALMLLDVQNPLMGIMTAMLFCICAPFAVDMLIEAYGEGANSSEYWDTLRSTRMGMPMGFALLGVLAWTGIESLTIRG